MRVHRNGNVLRDLAKTLPELLFNRVLTHVPLPFMRVAVLRRMGMVAGPYTYLFASSEVLAPWNIEFRGRTHVGRFCLLDGRGGMQIGENVVIASHSLFVTADHDPQDPEFPGRTAPIVLEDRVWIGTRATVLKGVTVGVGAVVAAGSVVVRDVEPWSIVAGNPARVIGARQRRQTYEIDFGPLIY